MNSLKTIWLAMFLPFLIFGQDCDLKLTGTVIDYHDQSMLPGATITILNSDKATLSNLDGTFLIKNLCAGNYEIEVSHPECSTVFIPIEITEDRTIEIKLEHHLEELKEVEVVGNSTRKQTNSAQESTLKLAEIEQYTIGSLGDALKELSGVSTLNTGAFISKPAIHGLNGSRVLLLNNGVRMQDMEWGDEHAPNIDINAAGKITVVKGASALKYGGDAIGGVILVEPLTVINKDSLFGKTVISGATNGRGGNINTELTKSYKSGWYVRGQVSYKRLGDQEAPDYVLSNTGIQNFGVNFNAGKRTFEMGWEAYYSYINTEIAILRASHIGNTDDLIRSINSRQPLVIRDFTYDLLNPRQQVGHHLAKGLFYKRFEGLGKLSLQYDFQQNQRFEYDIRRGEDDDRASIDLRLTTHTLSTDFKWDANAKLDVTVGLLARYQENFPNPDTGVRRLIPDYEKYDFGSFLIGEYKATADLTFDAGFRYDFSRIDAKKFYITSRWEERGYDQEFNDLIIEDLGTQLLVNPILDFNNISTTFGAAYAKDSNRKLRLNFALAKRAPNPSELFSDGLHHSASRIELGDLRIKSETSHKVSFSWEEKFEHWSFTLAPYANYIDDFILLEPTNVEFTLRGAFPVWSYRQTNARLFGLDFNANANWIANLNTAHQFSIVKGTDTENDIPIINIPAANTLNSITFLKPEWNNFEFSLTSNYVFEQNETPPNIIIFSPEQNQEVELDINSAPDAYHLINIQTQLQFNLGKNNNLTTSLLINNLTNTVYRDYLNRQRYFADDLGRNIIIQLKFNY
ncbi:TonB-dependent receptor [Croceivirga lutea]|uniref:TonB-dependent receptor n=1 Tax=Croceivirga lutea TaxID=1775167 RepID=UPI00163AFD92|nr:TonB-dependent receptor [Croceivirga lutea]